MLHVARQPQTGVWSMMRQLGHWQKQRGYRVVFGLLLPPSWPQVYLDQLENLRKSGIEVMTAPSPDIFGTGAYCYHQFFNPINRWAAALTHGTSQVIVHSHNAWLAGAYLPAATALLAPVVTYHGIQGERALRAQPIRRRIHQYWARRLARRGAHHASVDEHNARVAEDLFGVPFNSFNIIPNGTAAVPPHLSGCPHLRSQSARFTVGHAGYIDDGKGWRITAEAVRVLHNKGYDVHFLIAGSGPEAPLAKSWCDRNHGFATYLGYVECPETDVFPRLDVMVLPSRSEGLPMAVLEAFASAVPVITTPVGGLVNAIAHGQNGYLVDRDATSVAVALRRLIVDRDHHAQLSKGAHETHTARYSVSAMGRAYDALYEQAGPGL